MRETGVGEVDPDAGVGIKVVDVPLRTVRIRIVAKIGKEEDGLIVARSEGALVHGPNSIS